MKNGGSLLRSFALAAPCVAAVTCVASPALGDDAADTATARALGVEGVVLADAGRCRDAIEKLERAEKLHHAPTTATRLGECEIEVGKLVVGTERLQRVVREPLAPNAHPAFAAAVARAQRVLEKSLPRLATVRISVKAPPGAKLALAIDEEAVPEAALDTNRRIDPGSHRIQASARGCLTSTVTTTLEEGQSRSVVLELVPDPNAPKDPPPEEAGASRDAAAPEARGSKAPAIVAFGVGALGLGVGIYAATVVEKKSSTLSTRCDENRVCPSDLQPEISDAKRWATVSTVGFVTAGVGLATGLVLLVASGGGTPPPAKKGLRVQPRVGLSSVALDGVF
jgi:hypothetical protein